MALPELLVGSAVSSALAFGSKLFGGDDGPLDPESFIPIFDQQIEDLENRIRFIESGPDESPFLRSQKAIQRERLDKLRGRREAFVASLALGALPAPSPSTPPPSPPSAPPPPPPIRPVPGTGTPTGEPGPLPGPTGQLPGDIDLPDPPRLPRDISIRDLIRLFGRNIFLKLAVELLIPALSDVLGRQSAEIRKRTKEAKRAQGEAELQKTKERLRKKIAKRQIDEVRIEAEKRKPKPAPAAVEAPKIDPRPRLDPVQDVLRKSEAMRAAEAKKQAEAARRAAQKAKIRKQAQVATARRPLLSNIVLPTPPEIRFGIPKLDTVPRPQANIGRIESTFTANQAQQCEAVCKERARRKKPTRTRCREGLIREFPRTQRIETWRIVDCKTRETIREF